MTQKSKITLVNTHPTKAFVFDYNGGRYLFQPKKGYWAVQIKKTMKTFTWPQPNGQVIKKDRECAEEELVCVDPNRSASNRCRVPESMLSWLSKAANASKHGGHIKRIDDVQDAIERDLAERDAKIAHLEAQLDAVTKSAEPEMLRPKRIGKEA